MRARALCSGSLYKSPFLSDHFCGLAALMFYFCPLNASESQGLSDSFDLGPCGLGCKEELERRKQLLEECPAVTQGVRAEGSELSQEPPHRRERHRCAASAWGGCTCWRQPGPTWAGTALHSAHSSPSQSLCTTCFRCRVLGGSI